MGEENAGQLRASVDEKNDSKASNSPLFRVNRMVIWANHLCGPGTHRPNDISSRTQNDVESTANGQRAGGPLHLKGLTSRTDVPQSCASMTQEKI
jgi:hypothetical protein